MFRDAGAQWNVLVSGMAAPVFVSLDYRALRDVLWLRGDDELSPDERRCLFDQIKVLEQGALLALRGKPLPELE